VHGAALPTDAVESLSPILSVGWLGAIISGGRRLNAAAESNVNAD
jgi:hypothetical protein